MIYIYSKTCLNGTLFQDQAKTPAMIRHSMNTIQRNVDYLNHGQNLSLPLINHCATLIQWNWSDTHGEDQFVIMLGGLHIEMAALSNIGGWLEDSGWTNVNIASAGTAQSFLNGTRVSRTRHARQVTASSLYMLMQKAYNKYLDNLEQNLRTGNQT